MSLVVTREYDVELPTHPVRVLEWGPPDGRLVVALHGFPDTAWTWRRVAPLLADAGLRVAAPFLRGYAPSGIPADGDYSVRALAATPSRCTRRSAAARTPCCSATTGARSRPTRSSATRRRRTARHVSLAVPPFAAMNPSRATLGPWLSAMVRQPFHSWYIAANQVPGLVRAQLRPAGRAAVAVVVAGVRRPRGPRAAAGRRTRSSSTRGRSCRTTGRCSAAASSRRSPSRCAPLLYLHGDRDGALDPRFFPVVEHWMPPGSRAALVGGAGHFLQLEQPAAVAAEILAFVS